MTKLKPILTGATLALAVFFISAAGPASAYSCNAEFKKAQALIKEAQGLVKPDTDSRILALIERAKGMANAGSVSHKKANERHVGANGKHMHGQAVSMGRQAQAIAREALFLLSGQPR